MTRSRDEPSSTDACRMRLRLFIAGDGPNSRTAVSNLRALLEQYSASQVELEVIDVFKDPQRGLAERVFVTPMLLRVEPPPERRILGNLSDRAILLSVLAPAEALRE